MKRISISDEHGSWLGSCLLDNHGRITDCPVLLDNDEQRSEQLYKRMEEMIAEGLIRGRIDHYDY
jgi:hypothetical protein